MPTLIIKHGDQKTKIRIKGNVATIGQSEKNNISLNDPNISHYHCQLIKTTSGYKLVDLDTSKGTWVNNEKIKERLLKDKDFIRVGEAEISFLSELDIVQPQPVPAPKPKEAVRQQPKEVISKPIAPIPIKQTIQTPKPPVQQQKVTAVKPTLQANAPNKQASAIRPQSKLTKAPTPTTAKPKPSSITQRPSRMAAKPSGTNKSKQLYIIGGAVAAIILIIILVMTMGNKGQKNGEKIPAETQSAAGKLYKEIKSEFKSGNYKKAIELCTEFTEKYAQSKLAKDVKNMVSEIELKIRDSEAMEKWKPIKEKVQDAKPDDAAEILSEVRKFYSAYSGTPAAKEASGEVETLERLVAQSSPAIIDFNELRSHIDKDFVAQGRIEDAIAEYKKFLAKYPDDPIISGKVKREISKLEETSK